MPCALVIRIVCAFANSSAPISTRSRSSRVGINRANNGAGSTAVRIRVPAAWISNCSGENNKNVQSTTMSTLLSASTANRFSANPESPTAHAPDALAGAGSRRWKPCAPSF